jgi:hypothetical protein
MMSPSRCCKIIICRHSIVGDNPAATTAAAAADDDDYCYNHINEMRFFTLATGSETWAKFIQRIFQETVIEANSSRLLPLLVTLHPKNNHRRRFTAYRLRFGYGYATVIFPTWVKRKRRQQQQQHQKQQQQQQQQPSGGKGANNDVDEIIDALLEINVSICHRDDNNFNTSDIHSNQRIATTTTTTIPTTYLEAHETILESIGALAYSTTTVIELHYYWIGGDSSSSSSLDHSMTIPFPVTKSRTNICYCTEDENFPGMINDYELIVGNTVEGSGGDGGEGGKRREYTLPRTTVTALTLEGGLGRSRESISKSKSDTGGLHASNDGGLDARIRGNSAIIDHQKRNDLMTEASSNAMVVDDAGADDITEDRLLLVDENDPRQGKIDHRIDVEMEDKSVDVFAVANTVETAHTSGKKAGDLGKNAKKKEARNMLPMKESVTLKTNNTTSLPSDTLQIPTTTSPARSKVVLDIQTSPYSQKKRKVHSNDMKEHESQQPTSSKTVTNDAQLSSDKSGATPSVPEKTNPAPTLPEANIHSNAEKIANDNDLKSSLQKMENRSMTKQHTNIRSPVVDGRQNQESADDAGDSKTEQLPKKKGNIHTTSEKHARDLAMAIAGAQKKAFGENRIPCRARGLPADHNPSTAYFVITEDAKHGDELQCSHPECRISKKFKYCQHCKIPISSNNFGKHRHDVEVKKNSMESKKRDAEESSTRDDRMRKEKRAGAATGNAKKEGKEKTKRSRAK